MIAIAATKSDLVHTTTPSELVPTSEAEELAAALEAIFVDTSAKRNSNVELLYRRVAERVLQFRENARRGVVSGQVGGIPVTPGATCRDDPEESSRDIVVGVAGGGNQMNGGQRQIENGNGESGSGGGRGENKEDGERKDGGGVSGGAT